MVREVNNFSGIEISESEDPKVFLWPLVDTINIDGESLWKTPDGDLSV